MFKTAASAGSATSARSPSIPSRDACPNGMLGPRAEAWVPSAELRMEATMGFEPMHNGFADRPLNHLGTSPRCAPAVPVAMWLALEDSNLGSRIQSPASYH